MDNVKSRVPELRFPEFDDDWKITPFGDLLTLVHRPIKMNDEEYYDLVTVKRRFDGIVRRERLKGKDILVKSQFLVKGGDFVISKRQVVHGACEIVPLELEDSIVSNEYSVLKAKELLFLPFLNQNIKNPKIANLFFLSSVGVHIEKMLFRMDDWLKWEIWIPQKIEQQKIASFLTAVDEKIQQLTKKKELLEKYKKGVMQKIFSQEIRFKDDGGNDYPDWRNRRLKKIVDISKGVQVNKNTLSLIGKYPVMNGGIAPSGFTENYNREAEVISISEGGNSCGYVNYMRVKFWSGGHNYTLENISGNIDKRYLYQFLKHNEIFLMRLRVGSGLPNIQKSSIEKFITSFPISYQEQQKIADFLSSIDQKIDTVDAQIEKTKEFKKGLLQQMFV